jgi:hypothetical protein
VKLIRELNEDIQYIAEETNGKQSYYIQGIFLQSDIVNRNGRVYPRDVMRNEVTRYIRENVNTSRAFGELNHPEGFTINLDRVSHLIKSLTEDGTNWVGKAKILDTAHGKIVKTLIDEGARFGVSSRGVGSLKEVRGQNVVQEDFRLSTAADIVCDPSAPDAFVRGIMEGKEYIWDNGILREADISEMHKNIQKASGPRKQQVFVEEFTKFLKSL